MSFIGKRRSESPRVGKNSPFEIDFQGDCVFIYRWLNDRSERVLVGFVKYVAGERKVEIKLGVSSVKLGVADALTLFRACRDLVEGVWKRMTKPRVAWLS